jgi:hypothetical protein
VHISEKFGARVPTSAFRIASTPKLAEALSQSWVHRNALSPFRQSLRTVRSGQSKSGEAINYAATSQLGELHTALSSFACVGIEADPVDVIVDEDTAKVVED